MLRLPRLANSSARVLDSPAICDQLEELQQSHEAGINHCKLSNAELLSLCSLS